MSNGLEIAAVTAVLKKLLENELIKSPAMATMGEIAVTALPLDRVSDGSSERLQLNLFLYQISQNRNADWIARERGRDSSKTFSHDRTISASGASHPPLALNLHYLLAAYGGKDFQIELLLGFAMQLFHNKPVLISHEIQTVLKHLIAVNVPGVFAQALNTASIPDLTEQLGHIKIAPVFFNTQEIAGLWSILQCPYRPSIAYEVSTVLIEKTESSRSL